MSTYSYFIAEFASDICLYTVFISSALSLYSLWVESICALRSLTSLVRYLESSTTSCNLASNSFPILACCSNCPLQFLSSPKFLSFSALNLPTSACSLSSSTANSASSSQPATFSCLALSSSAHFSSYSLLNSNASSSSSLVSPCFYLTSSRRSCTCSLYYWIILELDQRFDWCQRSRWLCGYHNGVLFISLAGGIWIRACAFAIRSSSSLIMTSAVRRSTLSSSIFAVLDVRRLTAFYLKFSKYINVSNSFHFLTQNRSILRPNLLMKGNSPTALTVISENTVNFYVKIIMKSEQVELEKQIGNANECEDDGAQADSISEDQEVRDTGSREKAPSKKKPKEKPLICNVSDTKYPIVRYVCRKLMKFKLQKSPQGQGWDLMWTDNAVQPEQVSKMQPHQKINHFPGMYSLSRKNYLGRNLMRMRKKFPEEYNFFPLTWMLPSEWGEFKAYYEKDKKPKTFIVKPQASCQGRGIFLTRNIEQIEYGQHYVVQRYITKPFLVDELKFDFRIYVLLAGCSPMRIYLYDEGLTRFATQKYSQPNKDNIEQVCMHLTNYAINKANDNFVYNQSDAKMDTGHKRSLTSVLNMLKQRGHDVDLLWKQIKGIIIKTFCSAQPVLAHHYKSCQPDNYSNNMCFQILGLDIILDQSFKPYLLEVNYTPSFSTDTPLDKLIKKNVIKDSLVLMNITHKQKNQIVNISKDMLMKRMLTGKKERLTLEEKQEEVKKAQVRRDEWENAHLGGFEKIYPCEKGDREQKYQEFLGYAAGCYEDLTGANVRRNMKKEKSVQMNIQKKQSKNQQLQKIYKAKPPIPAFSRTVQQRKSNLSAAKVTTTTQQALLPCQPKIQAALKTNKTIGSQTYYSTLPPHPKKPSSQRHIHPLPQRITQKRDSGNYLRPKLFEISSNFSKDI